jgi:hypothetical protein
MKPILGQLNPAHTGTLYFFKFDINGLFLSDFKKNILYAFLVTPLRATCLQLAL